MRVRLLASLAVLSAAVALRAAVYTWTDEKGVVHYANKPPAAKGRKVKVLDGGSVSAYDPRPSAKGSLDHLQGPPAAEGVELFTTAWCGPCKAAKSYLSSRGIPFTEHDVEKDPSAAARAKALGWTGGVPFALINGQPVRGFSQASYDRLLAKK